MFAAAPVLNLSSNTKVSIVYFRELFKAKAGKTGRGEGCTGWLCEATCPWEGF